MFLSFGGLDSTGGYNIRVCRSKNPDGPYEDALGQDMTNCGGADGSFFDDKAIEGFGVKLMGGFRFMPIEGVEAMPEQAYKSPGHNSAIYDEKTGRYFLIMHTRFSALGDEHRVRVHEFWFNEQGWPVVAPLRYAGEIPEGGGAIAGEYRVVLHGRDVNKLQHRSEEVVLAEDGTVSGKWSGSWTEEQVELDGTVYRGKTERGYDPEQGKWIWTLTMLSDAGEALWGIRTEE